jgi:hypothetical protein
VYANGAGSVPGVSQPARRNRINERSEQAFCAKEVFALQMLQIKMTETWRHFSDRGRGLMGLNTHPANSLAVSRGLFPAYPGSD